jgi:hypothetical protein
VEAVIELDEVLQSMESVPWRSRYAELEGGAHVVADHGLFGCHVCEEPVHGLLQLLFVVRDPGFNV